VPLGRRLALACLRKKERGKRKMLALARGGEEEGEKERVLINLDSSAFFFGRGGEKKKGR